MFGNLAYSVGFFLGDGSLYSGPFISSRNGKTYYHNDVVFVKSDIEPIHRVQKQITESFGKEYNVQERTLPSGLKHFSLTAHRREIFDFFSVNTAMRQEIPQYYFSAPREEKLELLRGLMDSDGHSAEFIDNHDPKYSVKRWTVGFTNTKLPIVQGMASIMQGVGIKVGVISASKRAHFLEQYIIRPNIRSFHDNGMFFYSTRKQAKLNRYLDHMLGSETLYTEPSTQG